MKPQLCGIDNFETQVYAIDACRKYSGYSCCTSCYFPNTLPSGIEQKGLCEESEFWENFLTLEQDQHGNLTFYGDTASVIVYNEIENLWYWTLLNKQDAYAISKAPFSTFLLGKHEWIFYGDTCHEDGEEYLVNFSMCSSGSSNGDGAEFTCDNGLCISMVQRCDGIFDCEDSSDEKNCNKVKTIR